MEAAVEEEAGEWSHGGQLDTRPGRGCGCDRGGGWWGSLAGAAVAMTTGNEYDKGFDDGYKRAVDELKAELEAAVSGADSRPGTSASRGGQSVAAGSEAPSRPGTPEWLRRTGKPNFRKSHLLNGPRLPGAVSSQAKDDFRAFTPGTANTEEGRYYARNHYTKSLLTAYLRSAIRLRVNLKPTAHEGLGEAAPAGEPWKK